MDNFNSLMAIFCFVLAIFALVGGLMLNHSALWFVPLFWLLSFGFQRRITSTPNR